MTDSTRPAPGSDAVAERRDALLVIDVQNDFTAGGSLAVPDGDAVVPVINRLMPRFSLVVLTQDWHPPAHASFATRHAGRAAFEAIELAYGRQVLWPDHCVQGTRGADFHPGLDTAGAKLVLRKGWHPDVDSYSAFLEADRRTRTGLAGWLREHGVARVFLAGLATDFCVAWSALDARAAGFEAIVIEDACRAIDTGGSLAAAWRAMAEAGVGRCTSAALASGLPGADARAGADRP